MALEVGLTPCNLTSNPIANPIPALALITLSLISEEKRGGGGGKDTSQCPPSLPPLLFGYGQANIDLPPAGGSGPFEASIYPPSRLPLISFPERD